MKQLLFLFVAILLALRAWPQGNTQGVIMGRILDKEAGSPLSGATVALIRAKDSSTAAVTYTEKNGDFSLENIHDGNYRLYITYIGYKPLLHAVLVSPDN